MSKIEKRKFWVVQVKEPKAGFDMVGSVEFCDDIGGMSKIGCYNPRGFLIGVFITRPEDQVEQITGSMVLS